MRSDCENLLYHAVVFWLSHGKVFKRFVKIKGEWYIFLFLKDKCSIFAHFFCVDKWLSAVCSMLCSRYFCKNEWTVSLRGKDNVLTITEKVTGFQKKHATETEFWKGSYGNIFIVLKTTPHLKNSYICIHKKTGTRIL